MLRLDSTTRAEYDALGPAGDRAALVVAALGSSVTATVYDGEESVRASGSMQAPWASASGARIVVGELDSFLVTDGGVPDADWVLRFEGNGRWVEGSFGLSDSGADFRWSLETFTTGQLGAIGTAEITARGLEPVAADFAVSWNVHRSVEASFAAGWDLLATAPLTFSGVPDPIQIPKGGTYNLAQHASGGVPPYTYLAVGLPEHVTLNPATSVLTATEDAVTGSTTVEFTIKDSAIEQTAPGLPMQGQVWDGLGGPNKWHFMQQSHLAWKNPGVGDWVDASDVAQGSSPYDTFTVNGLGDRTVSVTALVGKWLTEQIPNKGFFLRGVSGSWSYVFAGRLHATVAARPVLTIETTDGTFTPSLIGVQHWIHASVSLTPGQEEWQVQTSTRSAIAQFDLSKVTGTVQSATLKVTCVRNFSTSTTTIGIFAANSPEYRVNGNMLTRGFADQYPNDVGIDAHPSVFWTNQTWGNAGDKWGGFDTAGPNSQVSVETDPTTGIKYLRLRMEPGVLNAITCKKHLMKGGETDNSPPTSIVEDFYFRYRLWLEDDWRSTIDTTKAPGPNVQMGAWKRWATGSIDGNWSPITGNGGAVGDGRKIAYGSGVAYRGHSVRGHVGHVTTDENPYNEIPHLASYCYHIDQADFFGEALRWGNAVIKRGRWYNIEQYIKMNTLTGEADALGNREANFDGVLRVWVDGELAFERTNLRWRRHVELGAASIVCEMYHGGTSPPDITMHCRWANLVIASEYIGPVKEEPL